MGGFWEDPESAGAAQPPEDRLKVKGTNPSHQTTDPQDRSTRASALHVCIFVMLKLVTNLVREPMCNAKII